MCTASGVCASDRPISHPCKTAAAFIVNQLCVRLENAGDDDLHRMMCRHARITDIVYSEDQLTVYSQDQLTVYSEDQLTVYSEDQLTVYSEDHRHCLQRGSTDCLQRGSTDIVYSEDQLTVYSEDQLTLSTARII
ncbi:hypothetical protein ACOMHN_041347 [Nucella lapillus]